MILLEHFVYLFLTLELWWHPLALVHINVADMTYDHNRPVSMRNTCNL